jgi:lysophospholipase L1-like esterase
LLKIVPFLKREIIMKQNIAAAIIALAALGASAQIKVACIGNSITQGDGLSNPSTQAYPARLQALLGSGYTVQNDGVSGTTILKNGDNPYWKNGKLAQVFNFQPAIVTIKLGTNDTKPQNWDSHYTEFRRDFEAMIDTLNTLSTKPKIFLVLPVPVWSNYYGIRDSALQKMIPIIKAIGAKRGLWIIDANTPLKNFSSYFSDGVHPNTSGADTIASVIYHSIIGNPSSFRFVARSHTSAQGTLSYRLFYPYKYDPARKYPLIITLHGVGESGTDNWIHITKNRLAEIWADDTT